MDPQEEENQQRWLLSGGRKGAWPAAFCMAGLITLVGLPIAVFAAINNSEKAQECDGDGWIEMNVVNRAGDWVSDECT